jgi:murein DD-endopeptidase MepM/ murein hydrolase activator NlpD
MLQKNLFTLLAIFLMLAIAGCSDVGSPTKESSAPISQPVSLSDWTFQEGQDIPAQYLKLLDQSAVDYDSFLVQDRNEKGVNEQTALSRGALLWVWFPFGPAQVDLWSGSGGTRTGGGQIYSCGGTINSHSGADYYARDMSRYDGRSSGQAIYSGIWGWVVRAGNTDGYGNSVVIWDPSRSVCVRYAHMQSVGVSVGQYINRAKYIGTVGNSPGGFSPHLHIAAYEHVPVGTNGAPVVPYVCMSEYYCCQIQFFIN